MLRAALLVVAVAFAACGPSPSQIAAVESTRIAEEFPIVPMKLVIVRGRSGAIVLALEKDGALRDEKALVGAVKAGRVVGTNGEERVAVLGDGRVTFGGRRTPLRFDGDALATDNGRRIAIDDSGNVVFSPPMRKGRGYSLKFEGFAPAARRTALLVLMLVVYENEKDGPDDD